MDISILVGKTLTRIEGAIGDDRIEFEAGGDEQFFMYHSQDCCESVYVDDIIGDLNDLIGYPILQASEDSNEAGAKNEYDESWTWTFYNIATVKGHVQIKWYGTSNGYYSESVAFEKL